MMESQAVEHLENQSMGKGMAEDDEEDFCSCCEDEEQWKEVGDIALPDDDDDLDETFARMYFKGISIAESENTQSGFSGIGALIENFDVDDDGAVIQLQKKLSFYAEELSVNYLALLDGLAQATQNAIRHLYAFTDCKQLYDQIVCEQDPESFHQEIVEYTSKLDSFKLHYVCSCELEQPLHLAMVAVGIVSIPTGELQEQEKCSICYEDKLLQMMIEMKCCHRFCSCCMKTYIKGKVSSSQVPIKCPHWNCKYYISMSECRSFLPLTLYESLEKALAEADTLHSRRIYCPYSNCSALVDPLECSSTRASSSNQIDNSSIECPVCQRFICVNCNVPWHSSMTCEYYQNLPLEERDASDITLHLLAENKRWRRCQQCRRMIELIQGCYHMTCWCGHEFCYACGANYRDGHKTCHCAFWDEDNAEDFGDQSVQESEQWAWETLNSLPMIMDSTSENEISQLAFVQRFLSGGFTLNDYQPSQSPPSCTESYIDAVDDLHHLPWLERFVSVISDNYNGDYLQ